MLNHWRVLSSRGRAAAICASIVVLYFLFYHPRHSIGYKFDHINTQSGLIGIQPIQWVKQSWMDYPHRISFAGSPSLLDTSSPKPLNVLLVNIHPGVRNDIQGMLSRVYEPLKQPVHIAESTGLHEQSEYIIDEPIAQDWYARHSDDCNSSIYDLMIIGDV